MRINNQKTKSTLFILSIIILSLVLNPTLFTIYNENIDDESQNQNTDQNGPNYEPQIYTSSNSPPNASYFQFYKEITINSDKVSADHNNFPLLISILDSDLRDQVQPDGDDIAFSNGTDWLDHEIELFDQTYNPSYAKLVAWVRIPILSGSEDTVIYMYYGNSTMGTRQNPIGVWDSSYVAVWHMDDNPTGALYDSTSNYNDGTFYGGMSGSNVVESQIGNGMYFDGNNDYISVANSLSLDITGNQITLEGWINLNTVPPPWDAPLMVKSAADNIERYMLGVDGGVSPSRLNYRITTTTGYTRADHGSIYQGTWTYLNVIYDANLGSNRYGAYIDANLVGSLNPSGNIQSTTGNLNIGKRASTNRWILGTIDELRISNVSRSVEWITTQYENQNDPNSFYSVSGRNHVTRPNPEDFNYFKTITIDHTKVSGSGNHTNFPVLISILDSDLKTDVQSDGDDIAFWNGSEWLDHEIEVFKQNYNSTHAQLIAWVRIPILSGSEDTVIYMYYGNSTLCSQESPEGVWDSDFAAVWHLGETTGGTEAIKDSHINNNYGTNNAGVTVGQSGQIGYSSSFTSSNDGITVPDDDTLDIQNHITVELWVNPDTVSPTYQSFISKGPYPEHFYFGLEADDLIIVMDGVTGGEWTSYGTNLIPGIWYHVAYTYNGSDIIVYKNGVEVNSISASGSLDTGTESLYIGRWQGGEIYDGFLDEIKTSSSARSAGWIATEYNNQYKPSSFYTMGPEQTGFANIQVNAIDLYGHPIPNVNISIFNFTQLKDSAITNNDGYVLFSNIPQSFIDGYNFTVNMTSNIEPFTEKTINRTSEAIKIDDPFHNITLICNASRNIFSVEDIDGIALDSGWIIVSKGLQNLQNCTIDSTGHATFRWLNTTGYSYKVWHQDVVYDPNPVLLKSDVISAPNIPIPLTVNLTTANFTVWTDNHDQVVSGVKLMFYNTSGASIVNFTTDMNGKATFRWLTTNSNYNYSLNVTFYGEHKKIKIHDIGSFVDWLELNITTATSYDIDMQMASSVLEDFETKIVLLMEDNIVKPWGTTITLRALFNVTKAGGQTELLGPTYADSMIYQIYEGLTLILSGTIPKESDYIGRHQCVIETNGLESKKPYTIIISASKEAYVAPSNEDFSLYLLENKIILNQSENDDSITIVYWLKNINMSVTPYDEIPEVFTIEDNIFQSVDHNFKFSIPDISSSWNLSEITFNIYNITWNVGHTEKNITIEDPYGDITKYTTDNHSGYDFARYKWIGITYTLDKGSPVGDNSFNFTIGGSFSGTVDIITDIYFIRDKINIEYRQFNVTDAISLLSDGNGWVIKNITFNLYNCRDPSNNWNLIDPDSAIEKLVTNEGINYNFISHDFGTGKIIIDNITIYPLDGQFLFDIFNTSAIMFDVNITVEYVQLFYWNEHLETINSSETFHNIDKDSEIQISVVESSWMDNGAKLLINGIWNGTDYFLPSDVEMNITINGITYTSISDVKGNGEFSLNGFNKNQIYTAVIGTNQSVNFALSFEIFYSRIAFYEIQGTITYSILGTDIFNQPVQYYEDLGCYIQTINTSLIDANVYSPYTIRFTCSKDNYKSDTIDLDLRVLERLTLLGYAGTNKTAKIIISSSLYVEESKVYTFSYIDYESGTDIQDLNSQSYDWNYYNTAGQLVDSGLGDLTPNADNEYVLDFNTEMRSVGRYEIWISLEKQNYESKQAIIILTVNYREIDYELGDMFEDKQTVVVKGEKITLSIELTDPTKGDIPLKGAKVILEIGDDELEFEEVEDGVYELEFDTKEYEAFFTSNTITGTIKISKANYTSEDTDITIVIEMEEIEVIPSTFSMPIFYLILLIIGIAAIAGSLASYRYIQLAKIPKFVKKIRSLKGAIKKSAPISESLSLTSKDTYLVNMVSDNWSTLGFSIEEILGIKAIKGKTLPIIKGKTVKPEKSSDLIPRGLILMKWDERVGTEIIVKYPKDIEISQKTLMQIYGAHEYTGESGMVNLMVGSLNIASYYTGQEKGYYLVLILNIEDDADAYEGGIIDVIQILLQNLSDDSYLHIIPSLFQRLAIYPTLNNEQHLINVYQDEVKRIILNRLRDEGVITKSELMVWLKDKYKEGFIDLDAVLNELIKREFMKQVSVKGMPSELNFLSGDLIILRVPPIKLFKNPEESGLPPQLTKAYLNEVKKFFEQYSPTEFDNIKIINILANPEVYQTFQLLRSAIVTKDDLEKLKRKGVQDVSNVLKLLWDSNMIKVLQDKNGKEYYALQSDFYIQLIFPKYLLKTIKEAYEQKFQSDKVLIEYLNILEDTYLNIKSKIKSEK